MKAKETWIEDTMNSLDGIQQAKSDPHLFEKLQIRIGQPASPSVLTIREGFNFAIAAAAVLLITLNILGAIYYKTTDRETNKVSSAMVNDYFSYLEQIKL